MHKADAFTPLIAALSETFKQLPASIVSFAVGVSGGADSAVLAVAATLFAQQHGLAVQLFHVNHGLQAEADEWTARVHVLGQHLTVPIRTAYVQVEQAKKIGIEAAARAARYQALLQLATQQDIQVVLLAHHQSDQAETVLLRLLRGAGVVGLKAMSKISKRDAISYVRPWLDIKRQLIINAAQAYTLRTGWSPVIDPSNSDTHYTRAALRTLLVPILDKRWPGWQRIVTRHAKHAAESEQILNEVASNDLRAIAVAEDQSRFSLKAWRELSSARQALMLRYWFNQNGTRMPSDAQLVDLMRQLNQLHSLGYDRHLLFKYDAHEIHCVRGVVFIQTEDGVS